MKLYLRTTEWQDTRYNRALDPNDYYGTTSLINAINEGLIQPVDTDIPNPTLIDAIRCIRYGENINRVKLIRVLTGVGLKEAVDFLKDQGLYQTKGFE